MKLLTFSTLYPNSAQLRHGIFVEQRLRHLLTTQQVEVKVVAPVPWFPFKHSMFGEYSKYPGIPKEEIRHGISVLHPRYPLIPKMGMTLAPLLMAIAMIPVIRKILRDGYDFDLIDAHYFYPDGVAATILGKVFRKPVVITARGTDISLVPKYRLPRRMILWAANNASGLITVCKALKDEMVTLGVPDSKVEVLRNGVDLRIFQPLENREKIRTEMGYQNRKLLLSVGHLIPRKGHDLVIKALRELPDVQLLLAGDGPEQQNLTELAEREGVRDRITFLGSVSHDQLAKYYSIADALVLASSREGWANVLLESMACGTPVVATSVWGTPEVVAAPEAGVLVQERSPDALAKGFKELIENYPDRAVTRRYAERFSWDETSAGQFNLFSKIQAGHRL